MSKVAIIKTNPKDVVDDYGRVMDLANYKKHLNKKFKTIIKLNLSWSLYYPACSTEPWQLDGVLKKMDKDQYKNIHPVENKTVVTDVWKGAKGNKWLPILKKYGLKYEPLTEVEWIKYKFKADTLAINEVFHDGLRIPKMFVGKNVLHLPTMKTHGHTMMTGSMKNAFGGLITKRRHHCHKQIHEVLVDLLKIQKEIHKGIFTVTDGTVAGDGAGPRTMNLKYPNLIFASNDSVAIDAVVAKIMGFDPLKIKFIKMAHDQGLGQGDIDQIDIKGDINNKNIKKINLKFKTKKSPVIFFDQTLRKKYPILEPLLFHTKLFRIPIFGSAFYHDKLWYPLVGKMKIRKFNKTGWGKLFKKYK
ncbi:DUF362 domain-containing protein [Nanoarchaeota archaeon]